MFPSNELSRNSACQGAHVIQFDELCRARKSRYREEGSTPLEQLSWMHGQFYDFA
jgi:hypothetical protein